MRCSVILAVLFFVINNSYAQELILDKSNKEPIDITAQELIFYRAQNVGVFTGDVIAVQGTVTVKAKKMEVFFKESAADSKETLSKVKLINLKDDVEIITPKEKTKSSMGVYNVETGVFTLTGDVVMTQGETILKGDRMIYNKNTEESLLTVNGKIVDKRVSAKFVPNQTDKNE